MATHDYVIGNQTSAAARSDINAVLQAIVSNNSSATEPAQTFGNMFWYDTGNNFLKLRNEADSAWVIIGYIDQATGQFDVRTDVIQAVTAGGTSVRNSSGSTILDLKPTSQATAEAGTNNTEIMTPLRTSQAISALSSGGLQHISTTVLGPLNGNTLSVSSLSSYRRVKCFFLLNVNETTPVATGETITFAGVTASGTTRTIVTLNLTDLKTGEAGNQDKYAQGIFGQLDVANMNNAVSNIYKHSQMSYGLSEDQITTSSNFSGRDGDGSSVSFTGHPPAALSTYDEAWNGIRITRNGGQFRADNFTYLSVWGE